MAHRSAPKEQRRIVQVKRSLYTNCVDVVLHRYLKRSIAHGFNRGVRIWCCISPEGTAELVPFIAPILSIPQIAPVIFNAVLFEQSQKLLLKRPLQMMRLLLADVFDDHVQLRNAHAKSPILHLPLSRAIG